MRIFCLSLLLNIFLSIAVTAQVSDMSALESVVASSGGSITGVLVLSGDTVAVSFVSGDKSQLVLLSLRQCIEVRRFNYDKPLTAIVLPKGNSSSLWGVQGSDIVKISLSDGVISFSQNILGENILGLSQNEAGDQLAVWSVGRLAILQVVNDTVKIIWSEISPFKISTVLLDSQNKYFYIAGSDGSLVKRSYTGQMENSFILEYPINGLAIDSQNQHLFIAMNDGLLRYNQQDSSFTRITSLPVDDVVISGDSNSISLIGNGVYNIFSYPSMKLLSTRSLLGKNLSVSRYGIVSYGGNSVGFYDQKTQSVAGQMFVGKDFAGVISADMEYYGNSSFRKAILDGMLGVSPYIAERKDMDQVKACYGIRNMAGGATSDIQPLPPVAAATVPPQTFPAVPSQPPVQQQVKPPSQVPTTPAVSASSVGVKPPSSPVLPSNPNIPTVGVPGGVGLAPINSPTTPTVAPVGVPTLSQGSDIPSWVISPNALPMYSAVKSGKDGAEALGEAKKKIREDIARAVMKNMLNVELVKSMPNDEVKKRFLWMVSGRSAQVATGYVMQKDLWISPSGQFYILGQIDGKSVDQIYEPIFQDEMKQLSAFGRDAYLAKDPIKWE